MKKILFIYGYGGSPESKFCTLIRDALPKEEYEVLCPEYPQEDCAKAHEFLLKYIEEHDIDLIIGTSQGGFIALILDTNVSTIVLNPCMVPSVELPRLEPRDGHPDDKKPTQQMIDTYKPFEPDAFNKEAYKRRWIMGMFAEKDELQGTKYKDRFIDCYDRVRTMPGGHHGNKEAIPTIIKEIKAFFAPAKPTLDASQLKDAPHGDIVIRIIEGGNSVMKLGDSKCGYTPGLAVGTRITLEYPNGTYTGGYIESINWTNETFKKAQSTYSFHFVKK